MTNDGDQYNVPARKIETLIEQRIFGRCTHPAFTVEEYCEGIYLHADIVCRACGVKVGHPRGLVRIDDELDKPFDDDPTESPWSGWTSGQLLDALRRTIAPHCLDIITTRIVLRDLEKKGWSWRYESRDGMISYTLSKNGRDVTGAPAREEHVAIGNALGELVSSPNPI
jgi:hypothetical protein